MAITALHSAATGLTALNTQLDVTANNLANSSTIGFKASRVNFEDLLYMHKLQPGVENAQNEKRPIGLAVGLGTRVFGTQLNFEQGTLQNTGRQLDVAIEGQGFFRAQVPADKAPGGIAYTRAGQLTISGDGELVFAGADGARLDPPITVSPDADKIDISSDGVVSYTLSGQAEATVAGTIQTSTFVNPSGLKQIGQNLFIETGASGAPVTGNPQEANRGQLRAGFLEGSNVDPTSELIELIKTQRAFEMNSQVIRAADDALRTIAQLRR